MGNNPIAPLKTSREALVDLAIVRLKKRYVLGEFDIDEFERRLDALLEPKRRRIAPPTVV